MLDNALKYESELQAKLIDTMYSEKYKFYNIQDTYCSVFKTHDDNWDNHQFVSLDNSGNVIGLIHYSVDRVCRYAHNLGILNLTDKPSISFVKDVLKVIDDIFCKFNFHRLEFAVCIGNPAERGYDKFCEKFGGSIVGVKHRYYKLMDGEYYDQKSYEVLRENYIAAKNGELHKEEEEFSVAPELNPARLAKFLNIVLAINRELEEYQFAQWAILTYYREIINNSLSDDTLLNYIVAAACTKFDRKPSEMLKLSTSTSELIRKRWTDLKSIEYCSNVIGVFRKVVEKVMEDNSPLSIFVNFGEI